MKKRTALLAALLGGVVLLCAGVIWWQRSGPGGGVLARVYQRGELVEEIRLDRVREAYSFPLTGEGGAENVVEVEPGRIPDRLRYLSRPGVRPPGVDLRLHRAGGLPAQPGDRGDRGG